MVSVELEGAIDLIEVFLQPVLDKIVNKSILDIRWNSQKKGWE